jgi:hypothetical protein
MAHAAKLSVSDVYHQYIVGTGAHLEAGLIVTYRAVIANAMQPVGKYHWAHAGFFCPVIEYYIAKFGMGG